MPGGGSPTGVPAPKSDAALRMSDRDREQVVARLHEAVGEGRLTISEFEERLTGVLAARTFGEVTPYVADLPAVAHPLGTPPAPATMSVRGSSLRRSGRWVVPPTMHIQAAGSRVLLDYTEAVISSSVVQVDVDARGSSVKLIVPLGSSVDVNGVSLHGSSARSRRLATSAGAPGTHFVVTGVARGSSVKAYPPRQWRWPWERR